MFTMPCKFDGKGHKKHPHCTALGMRNSKVSCLTLVYWFFILEIAAAFKLFDKNGDGEISVEELGEAMKQAGQEMSVEDLKDMIKAVDRNSK